MRSFATPESPISHHELPGRPRSTTSPTNTSPYHPSLNASTAPPPRPPLPPSLRPGVSDPSTINNGDLFFRKPTLDANVFYTPPGASPPQIPGHRPHHSLHHTRSVPPIPTRPHGIGMYRTRTDPPVVPPRPTSSPPPPLPPLPPPPAPELPPLPPSLPYPDEKAENERNMQETAQDSTGSPAPVIDEEAQLAMALAMSASESGKQQKLISQEEEDLARALQASLNMSPQTDNLSLPSPHQDQSNAEAGPSRQSGQGSNSPSAPIKSPLRESEPWGNWGLPPSPNVIAQISSDEEYARKLAEELAAEEEAAEESQAEEWQYKKDSDAQADRLGSASPPDLPRYADLVANPSPRVIDKSRSFASMPNFETSETLRSNLLRNSSTGSNASSMTSALETRSLPGSIATAIGSMSSQSAHDGSPYFLNPPTPPVPSSSPRPSLSILPNVLPAVGEASEPATVVQAVPSALNPSTYVDAEFLQGVSIGFTPPVLSRGLVPMVGPIPNIISLPYGKCPPLHLQAPSWRHLLKLMARLSGTRMEPTVEAMAGVRGELKLRTIVQFIRFHPSSPDWRTILWFSIDYPPPPTAPKHAIGDVNTLPWSYTFSSVPDLLREGAETPLSKYYTIPSTEPVPFPSLPISFPNLAMYLTAALEYSRSAINDSSSNGVRKLSRMIDQCYPSAFDEPRSPEKKSFGGRLKTFIGVGAKNVNKPRGLNEDTYDLVTPFVADEWG